MNSPDEQARTLQDYARLMKSDWDERARQDPKWFIKNLTAERTEAEFDETGEHDVQTLLGQLKHLVGERPLSSWRMLEIGCGIGRMTKFLAEVFGEVHATDVSGEMIRQARQRLAGRANVHLHETNGLDLAALPSDYFDLVYSFIVYQHIPSAAIIRANLDEAYRVLKPGGLLHFQTNSLTTADYEALAKDTWIGAAFPETELRRFARESGGQLISILGAETYYCWTTLRKRAQPTTLAPLTPLQIVCYGRADELSVKAIPITGPQAHLTLILYGLAPDEADANNLSVELAGRTLLPQYVGPPGPGSDFGLPLDQLVQLNQHIPPDTPPGLTQVRVRHHHSGLSEPLIIEFHLP
jgi:ubiquinone/menaquinone biosynthesis C-methylase UbiE